MVLRPVYGGNPDPNNANMTGYYNNTPPAGPPPGHAYGGPGGEQPNYPPQRSYSPYPPPPQQQHSPMASPAPPTSGAQSYYGAPSPHPPPPPQQHSGYYSPQPQYAGSPPPAGQYPPQPGYGYGGSQGQQSYYPPPHQQSPYQAPAQPQYAASPQPSGQQTGYPPQIKQEYSPAPVPGQVLPQSEEERGLLGALAGGAAGGFAGHKMNHGFLGALGGAFAGHKLQDAYKDHHQKPSRPSSSSSSSSSDNGKKKHSHPKPQPQQQHYAAHGGANRGNFSQSAARISLDKDHDLIAECTGINGHRKLSSIALNRLLTNDDGHFRWSREGNFAASARGVQLVHGGRFLRAELCRCDGSWRWDEICLDERIENSDGNLEMLW